MIAAHYWYSHYLFSQCPWIPFLEMWCKSLESPVTLEFPPTENTYIWSTRTYKARTSPAHKQENTLLHRYYKTGIRIQEWKECLEEFPSFWKEIFSYDSQFPKSLPSWFGSEVTGNTSYRLNPVSFSYIINYPSNKVEMNRHFSSDVCISRHLLESNWVNFSITTYSL